MAETGRRIWRRGELHGRVFPHEREYRSAEIDTVSARGAVWSLSVGPHTVSWGVAKSVAAARRQVAREARRLGWLRKRGTA